MASDFGDEVQDNVMTSGLGASQDATDGGSKGKQGRQRLCPHCSDVVSRATYFRHKRAFYDHQTKEWNSSSQPSTASCRAGEVGGDSAPPLIINDGRRCHIACAGGMDRNR